MSDVIVAQNLAFAHPAEEPITGRLWSGQWIWSRGHRDAANYNVFLRGVLTLAEGQHVGTTLHLSAANEYKLYVNGRYVTHGPVPSRPEHQSYDTLDLTEWLLPGLNTVVVHCYVYGVGVHWQVATPGGLIADLVDAQGAVLLATDGTWLAGADDCRDARSPRTFWSSGFQETYRSHRDPLSASPTVRESLQWEPAEVLGSAGVEPWSSLEPRLIPQLRESPYEATTGIEGKFDPAPLTVLTAHQLNAGQPAVLLATTAFHLDEPFSGHLILRSDDASQVFLGDALVIDQSYRPGEVATKLWRGADDVEQIHLGMTMASQPAEAPIHLDAGSHTVRVAIDLGVQSYGFLIGLRDDAGHCTDFRLEGRRAVWSVLSLGSSTGLPSSLNGAVAAPDDPRWHSVVPADGLGGSTHFATQMALDARQPQGAVALAGHAMAAGDYLIIDLEHTRVGFPRLLFRATEDTTVDVGYSQNLNADHAIQFGRGGLKGRGGMVATVDRLILHELDDHAWEPMQRRTARYLHLAVRRGSLVVNCVGVREIGYPVELRADFACSDEQLNRIWAISDRTSRMLMQYGYQDCLKREQGNCNANQATYQSLAAAFAYGDTDLARKCLLAAVHGQQDDGWFDGHGQSSPNQDETTLALYWLIWLESYYLLSGDRATVEKLLPRGVRMLRWFGRGRNALGLIQGDLLPVSRPGQIIYLDDSQCFPPYVGHFKGELVGLNILYGAALKSAAGLFTAMGNTAAAAQYGLASSEVRRALFDRFWDDEQGHFSDWRDGEARSNEGHAVYQIAALHHGMAAPAATGPLLQYLERLGGPDGTRPYPLWTFGYYYYLLEVLFEHGMPDAAYAVIRQYFGRFLELGATTFGEHFAPYDLAGRDRLFEEYEVHGYGTSAHSHFYTHILGVRPTAAGMGEITIAPNPGDLAWALGRVATPLGDLHVSWQQNGGLLDVTVVAPEGIDVDVSIPAHLAAGDVHISTSADAAVAR